MNTVLHELFLSALPSWQLLVQFFVSRATMYMSDSPTVKRGTIETCSSRQLPWCILFDARIALVRLKPATRDCSPIAGLPGMEKDI